MATYTDPVTGQRRDEVDDMIRPARGRSWGLGLAVLIILAVVAWLSFGRMSPTLDNTNTGASTITAPVTAPPLPKASPTQPEPSPNPGP